MSELKVFHLKDAATTIPEPQLQRQVLAYTSHLMLVRHQMEKGWRGLLHSHPHEQLVYVIKGRLGFQAGSSTVEITAGDSFVVPGGMDHQAWALEESEVLDVFHPCREDYALGKL